MAISTSTGVQIYIGSSIEAENLSQFLTESWVEIGEVEDLGEFGDNSEQVTFASLADSRLRKLKGIRDAGDLALVVGADDTDVGQDALIAAEATTFNYNFKVVLNDAATLGGTPSEHYFYARVMGKRLTVGAANNVVRRNFTLGINSAVTSVDAT